MALVSAKEMVEKDKGCACWRTGSKVPNNLTGI